MTVRPCAKINLGLNVVRKREDGYHDLETVFYPIPLCDRLEVEQAKTDSFAVSGIPLDEDGDNNLVFRAIRLLREGGYAVPPLSVRLSKNIPPGAGLGGGSSDAAFTVRMLNRMFSLGMGVEEMRRFVSRLGADCTFFVEPRPVLASGIGDALTPVSLDLRGMFLVLVKPPFGISTREAYSRVRPHVPSVRLADIIGGDISAWRGVMVNDFEDSVFPLHPEIAAIKEELYRRSAVYASMSGSGSSVYGIFRRPVEVDVPTSCFRAAFVL